MEKSMTGRKIAVALALLLSATSATLAQTANYSHNGARTIFCSRAPKDIRSICKLPVFYLEFLRR